MIKIPAVLVGIFLVWMTLVLKLDLFLKYLKCTLKNLKTVLLLR